MIDRFTLEDNISKMLDTSQELDDIIYKCGDDVNQPSEDDILNLLIGVKALHEARYNRLWSTFEMLMKNKTINDENATVNH